MLEGVPRYFWGVLTVAALSVVYLVLQVSFVRPYLWPGGHGLVLVGDSAFAGSIDRTMLLARPPGIFHRELTTVRFVLPESPAAAAGLAPGDEVVSLASVGGGNAVVPAATMAPADRIAAWRMAYWIGVRGPVKLDVRTASGAMRTVVLERPSAWLGPHTVLWAQRHLGMVAQIIVFISCAVVLLFMRSNDVTAALGVMALTLCAVGGGGPLMGSEAALPIGLRQAMTLFAWVATPIAFPFTGLAILYFPTESALLARQPWLRALGFVAAAPMIAMGTLTGLYLIGLDQFAGAALWDAGHPTVYYLSFAAALGVNVWAIVEGIGRFRANHDADERRRIRLVVYTAVPGVFAYVLKDGLPLVVLLATGSPLELPWWITAFLQALVLLPAFGLTYSVAVHRVLGPRIVLRNSMRYALARQTLTAFAALPALALVLSLIGQKDKTLTMIVEGKPLFYILTLGLLVTTIKYREKARTWLDQRFFREEYDARAILMSLAGRVPYETDPNDLTAMVVDQIDKALHPEMVAVMVGEIEQGRLTPVSILHGSAESLSLDGPLMTMLRWSEEPLDIDLKDPKSPTRRLPPDEHEWLECSGTTLLVPVSTPSGQSRSVLAVIALGKKRSEEPYTSEDRQLLASIAGQVSLALDVARLRSRASETETPTGVVTADTPPLLIVECPQCGRCEDASVRTCPTDGMAMSTVMPIPRVIDAKYRIDQVIGRGGMGAVYRAHDMRLDRDVAVKVVRAELLGDPGARSRFRREAQIVAKLQHPSVVAVFDYGTFADGGAYLVMEFIRGADLRSALKRKGKFAPDATVRLLTPVCSAIEAAHRQGILHRDLKPENILMPQADVDVKVLDFGIAKLVSTETTEAPQMDTLTHHGQIIGTPAYMAPEQLRGGSVDARTDVFSLGVIAYEMLTGDLPFGKGSMVDIALRHSSGVAPMAEGGVTIAAPLERAVRNALSHDPTGRPESAAAFASSLHTALHAR